MCFKSAAITLDNERPSRRQPFPVPEPGYPVVEGPRENSSRGRRCTEVFPDPSGCMSGHVADLPLGIEEDETHVSQVRPLPECVHVAPEFGQPRGIGLSLDNVR